MRAGAAAAMAALVLLPGAAPAGTAASPAGGAEASAAEVRRLALSARSDPVALEQLRAIERVDGRELPVGALLRGTSGERLDSRLRALGSARAGPPAGSAEAGERARAILAEGRFHEPDFPRPLKGVFTRAGEWLAAIAEPVLGALDALAELVPGGSPVLALLAAVVLLLASAVLATRGLRRRERRRPPHRRSTSLPQREERESSAALEAAAERAEREGDLAGALRLRFRAGVARLEESGRLEPGPSATTGQLSRALGSPDFDSLATSFDRVAYGGLDPRPEELEAARAGWRRVLAEAGGG